MRKKIKKNQRSLLVILISLCMGIILLGGVRYIRALRNNLQDQAIESVMTVTMQQQVALDNFISGDRERLHSYAEFFGGNDHNSPEEIQRLLTLFKAVDATCTVVCLDDGWMCSNISENIYWVDEENLDIYRELKGSGIRDAYIGMFTGTPRFGYYESFTFGNGHEGLIQKSYDRNKVSETFSLSFYNGRGFAYILDQEGNILLRSVGMSSDRTYDNVFEALTDTNSQQEDIDAFAASLNAKETGSLVFGGKNGEFVYTYVPLESVDGWYLLSIVPMDAIREETDGMLRDSQKTFALLTLVLVICAMFIILIWRTQKDIKARDRQIKYQARLFDVFVTYLSSNTDDVYMMQNHETGVIEYVSPNVERVLGMGPDDLLEALKAYDMAVDAEAAQAYYAEVRALLPGSGTASRNIERINPKTGEKKYFQENTCCVSIQGYLKRVVYISDRTKEHNTQSSLFEALQMAQAANDAKSSFLSNVSHDIRTPMNSIIGFLTLMRDEADNADLVREYTQRIDAASQHLLGLINDVLDMNKIESGSATLNISEMNLAEIIDEINTIIRPQTRAKNQTFDLFVSHLSYEHLLGDKLRINQILINLLSNAVKYTPEGGAIEMRVEECSQVLTDYSRIRFTIRDNGLGMSKEYLKVIFDSFTREETEVTRQIQGTGLGMAITKSLVDLMGGTIDVQSELGKGSIFTVELELHILEQEEKEDVGFWDDHSIGRMIVADDEEEVCQNIVRTMSKTGVTTDYCTDGQKVIEMMRTAREAGHPYDLILLDWKMPNLNGLETARLIRKNYPDKIPILLLTAYDWSEIEQEAMEIGVDHFMPKPFFMSTFKEVIKRIKGNLEKEKIKHSDVVRNKNILVVDDIEANRIILVKILNTLGANCNIASNGQEAVVKFETSEPGEYDLILMDVQMPVMDGYTATKTIRGSKHPCAQTIPIIAMTANAFVDDVRDAIASGMDAHIAKPVQLDKLKTTIQEVFERRQKN